MKNNLFVNREKEIEWLSEAYRKEKAQLLIIYGRRRIGKSFLITHFIKKKPALYHLCSEENEKEQIIQLSTSLGKFFNDAALTLNPFSKWEDFFIYLYEKTKNKRFILVIDEFPYLVNANPAVSSIFQKYWDLYLKKSKICIILSGSSIGIMESVGIKYKSPLYGRRTGQWRLNSLKFKDVIKFFKKNIEEIIRFYSMTGGVPFYIVELDKEKTAIENIKMDILKKGNIFYDEGGIVLKSELKEASTFFSILRAIANGATKHSDIANKVKIETTSLPKYLATLIELGFISKTTLVIEKEKSKKVRYLLKDNFMNFWFRFIEPSKRYVEEENEKEIEKILDKFELYVSKKFEELVREDLIKEINKRINIFSFEKVGIWWGHYRDEENKRQSMEIDIVALNNKTKEILFGECKWKDNVSSHEIVSNLIKKTEYVDWNKSKRKEYFIIFAKSFSKKVKEFEGKEVYCFDLDDLEKLLKR